MKFSKDYSKLDSRIFTTIRKNTRYNRVLGNTGSSILIMTPTKQFWAYIIAKNKIKKKQFTEKLARTDADCSKAELIAMLEKWYGKEFDDFLLITFMKEARVAEDWIQGEPYE